MPSDHWQEYDDLLLPKKINDLGHKPLEKHQHWIDRAKAKEEFTTDIATDAAAIYFGT